MFTLQRNGNDYAGFLAQRFITSGATTTFDYALLEVQTGLGTTNSNGG